MLLDLPNLPLTLPQHKLSTAPSLNIHSNHNAIPTAINVPAPAENARPPSATTGRAVPVADGTPKPDGVVAVSFDSAEDVALYDTETFVSVVNAQSATPYAGAVTSTVTTCALEPAFRLPAGLPMVSPSLLMARTSVKAPVVMWRV
jgi:hypothetical protein